MKKLQLEDLAKKLGYSKTLISMVLNGKGNHYGVSKKTQALVLEAIEKLDYTPNKFAKSLRTGKSHFVGLIVSDISNPFYSTIAKKIEEVLFEKGYNLMVCSAEEDERREAQMVDMMLEQQSVDGLIVASAQKSSAFYERPKYRKVPVVFIDRVVPGFNANYIVIDNYGGSVEVVNHLWKQGCRRIACLAITPLYLSTIEDRINGYRNALAQLKPGETAQLARTLRFDRVEQDLEKQLMEFAASPEPPDAFYCLNNNIAVSVLLALKKKEFRKLSNARVASFDDLALFDLIDKKVTAVSQPVEEIGRTASQVLIDVISGKKKEHSTVVLPTRLVKR